MQLDFNVKNKVTVVIWLLCVFMERIAKLSGISCADSLEKKDG